VRRNIGCHTYGNSHASVAKQIGEAAGKHHGLLQLIIKVGDEIHDVLFNIRQPDLLPEGLFADGAVSQSSGGAFSDLDPVEAEILKYIDTQGVSLEQLETYTQMDTGELAAMLMRLEFKFLIRRGADMLYYRER
jgi:hypothetical protein